MVRNKFMERIFSGIAYAGINKLRGLTRWTRLFGISSSSHANVDLQHRVAEHNRNLGPGEQPLKIIEADHSRGSMTASNAAAWQVNNGWRDVPLARVDFNGAAANAQRMANRVDIITSGQGVVTQATHRMDLVSRVIGGNPATGGTWGFKRGFHVDYGPNIDEGSKYFTWGVREGSEKGRIIVIPRKGQ